MHPAFVHPSLNPRAPRRHQRGQNLVELAIVMPVFMLFVLAILDFGRIVYASHVVANCACEGARYGKTHPADTENIITVTRNTGIGLDPSLMTVTVSKPTEDNLRVEVHYTFRLITPFANVLGRDSFDLHSVSTMYLGY
jgi:Flp pilus assembly protein TadG